MHISSQYFSTEIIGPVAFPKKKEQEAISITVPPPFEGNPSELEEIELVLINSGQRELSRIWNELMNSYHYLGSGPLCGAQIRYLVKSSRYGWVGGLAFSGAAWRLESRDRFIGWSDDERLNSRLLTLVRGFYEHPQANIPQACGTRAKTKAAYRFFENDETDMDRLLEPHYESTTRRISEYPVVLVAQDTSSLNYTSHRAMKDIGPIASRRKGSVGLLVHDRWHLMLMGPLWGFLMCNAGKESPMILTKNLKPPKLLLLKRNLKPARFLLRKRRVLNG